MDDPASVADALDRWGDPDEDIDALIVAHLPEKLRERTCPAGLPHTGDDPASDHGHTDCWFMQLAATEIERTRSERDDLAVRLSALTAAKPTPLVALRTIGYTDEQILDTAAKPSPPYDSPFLHACRQAAAELAVQPADSTTPPTPRCPQCGSDDPMYEGVARGREQHYACGNSFHRTPTPPPTHEDRKWAPNPPPPPSGVPHMRQP
jgi:hypothetical protein